jgi:hypothetical protein
MKKILLSVLLVVSFSGCGVPEQVEVPESYTEKELYSMWYYLPHSYPQPYVSLTSGIMNDAYIKESQLYNNYRTYNGMPMTFEDFVNYMTRY